MKYQCSVCGQIIDRNDVCPICGSGSDRIISVEESEEATTYRCLNCGRVFEDKDVCPYCEGEDLYDLTHDTLYSRKDHKHTEQVVEPTKDGNLAEETTESFDILSAFAQSTKAQNQIEEETLPFEEDEVFPEQNIVLEHEEEAQEEADQNLIEEDPYENSDIIKEEITETPLLEEETQEIKEETSIAPQVDDMVLIEEPDEIQEKVNEDSLLELKVQRLDLTKDLIIKLFLIEDETLRQKTMALLYDEISILKDLDPSFESISYLDVLKEKQNINQEIFDEEKTALNGYILHVEGKVK